MSEELKHERKLFEATIPYRKFLGRRADGSYELEFDEGRWQGWQMGRASLKVGQGEAVELAVWYGPMPESNGKSNYTAILHRKGIDLLHGCIITLDRSEYPDRVRYEADRARFLIGEINEEPCILDYDADKRSDYVAPPASASPPGWRCYHCDEHFTDVDSAGLHFGTHQHQSPACLIDVAEYRAMEARMHAYNEEDAEIHRAMAKMHGEHRTALQREEEKGYARALKDTGYDASADAVSVPRNIALRMAADAAQYDHEHAVVNDNVQLWQQPNARVSLTVGDLRTVRALLAQAQEVKS